MTSFWDDPTHQPLGSWPVPGGPPMEGTVTRMAVEQSRYGRPSLCVELDGDGVKRWCGMLLWRSFAELRVEPGERVRVTRLPGEPGLSDRPTSRWRVERLNAAPAAAPAASWGPDRPQW